MIASGFTGKLDDTYCSQLLDYHSPILPTLSTAREQMIASLKSLARGCQP